MENMLPKNWVETDLKSFCFSIKDKGEIGVIPYLEIGAVNVFDKKYQLLSEKPSVKGNRLAIKNDILVSRVRPTRGAIVMVNEDVLNVSSAFTILRSINKTSSKLLFYFLSYNKDFLNFLGDKCTGTMYPTVSETELLKFQFYLPPLFLQQRIVTKLEVLFGHLDSLKTRLNHMPQILKNFRQALLTQAVTGKLTEEWRVGKELEDASINVNLGSYLTEIKYGTSKKSDYGVDGMPILRIPNIKDGEIDTSDLKFSILDEKEYQKVLLKKGDVLIIRSNGSISIVGKTAIVRHQKEMGYAGYLVRLRSGEKLNSEYLNYMLSSPNLRRQIEEKARSTSGVNNINTTEIKELKINVFDIKEQTEIVKRVEHLFAKADAIEAQYQSLKTKIDSLPQAILAKAFKGELVEQLDTDGDAKELLAEIQKLKAAAQPIKKKRATRKQKV
ncbi:restriction endonuclease subunit S [Polaribacter dokdonensis]|uniref:Type I restriction enzyme, S subunit n=1 Tax=Polaribacter dokdonensis DSW-5 TaxID=1300348 RepID=A0A0N0CFK1_9FLAO|nr:restriction endonuclease subunit S [Polaribacter dokdonensis]KOY51938.1 Type I restriction enzyme, S subunit [Polaribacter dokdonensis DSW-5]SED99447.1 type I restriction enzyme, S subunit [Polaribacter dokdonensis DSW-5]